MKEKEQQFQNTIVSPRTEESKQFLMSLINGRLSIRKKISWASNTPNKDEEDESER